MDKQISMIHIKSGIKCLILFQNDNTITESIDIIKRFANDPMCKGLFTRTNNFTFFIHIFLFYFILLNSIF